MCSHFYAFVLSLRFSPTMRPPPPLLPRIAASASATPPRRQRTVRPPMPPSPALLSSTPPPAAFVETPKPETTQQHPPTARRRLTLADEEWHPLPLSLAELSLPLTLPTGQTFLWRRTSLSPLRFTAAVGPHLVSLSHLPDDDRLAFLLHNDDPASSPSSSVAAARAALCDYLNAAVPLADLWVQFTAADARFAEVAARLGGGGARVLRQDPVECLFQFLCSSNNNIARIEKMVWTLAGYGERLGEVGGFVFHRFPTVERLARVSEQELREAGFGYRAKYVVGTAKELMAKPGGGAKWLALLRDRELLEVIEGLCTLPGVGPKVAACIALFSLDKNQAIPVDTHVWKVATQYMLPELAGKSLTPKLSIVVADAFVAKFGEYAGWAQNVLFIGQLPAKKLVATEVTSETAKPTKRKRATKMVEIQA
ncbi:N-glycosylase/DNA lyase OGG1 isoform X2 [Aegilops tauschii subsp. strangulata]